METMLEELKLRFDNRITEGRIDGPTRASVSLYEVDQHGDQRNLHFVEIQGIGADYIEIEGEGLVDRKNIRGITPINF
jgi:hypothetical protein